MGAIKSLAAIYLFIVGIVVAVHLLATQLYDPGLEGTALTVWRILDPLMVAGLAIVVVAAFARKRRSDTRDLAQPVDREYLESNFTLYYSAALLLMLLWNWFDVEFVAGGLGDPQLWILIDVSVPLLTVTTALRFLRDASR